MRRVGLAIIGLIGAMVLGANSATADSITINYFTIASTDRDANTLCCGIDNNEVQNLLGPDGLPVLNTAPFGCLSNCFTDKQPTDVLSNGEITYWDPLRNNGGAGGTSDVTATGSALLTLPVCVTVCNGGNPINFFPPNGTGGNNGGQNGYQAAILEGTLNAPTTELVSFSIGADDMAFAYLDGQLVCDLGGVHAVTPGTCVTPFDITAGPHKLQVFFVDINQVQAGLFFNVTTQGVTTNAPEPLTLSFFGAMIAGLALALRRRRKQSVMQA